MTRQHFTRFLTLAALAALFCAPSGCKSKQPNRQQKIPVEKQKAAETAPESMPNTLASLSDLLTKQGFDPRRLADIKGDLYYIYELTEAYDYDAQIPVVLGKLLGLLAGYTKSTATVVFVAHGEPLMTFTAQKNDLLDLAAGKITGKELFLRLKVKTMNK